MKKLFAVAFSVFIVTSACNNINRSSEIDKVRIKNAKSLLLSNTKAGTGVLMKQTSTDQIEPVYFILKNGDSLTYDVRNIVSINDAWVMLAGNFDAGNSPRGKYMFVNKENESIYILPSNFDFNLDDNAITNRNAICFAGSQPNEFYLPSMLENNLYKFTIGSSGAVAEKFSLDNKCTINFAGSKSASCGNKTQNCIDLNRYGFKPASGQMSKTNKDSKSENLESGIVSGRRINDSGFFTGIDGEAYMYVTFCSSDVSTACSLMILKVEEKNNKPAYTKIIEKQLNARYACNFENGLSAPIYNPIRKSVFFEIGNYFENKIVEFKNNDIEMYDVSGSYGQGELTKGYIINIDKFKALDMSDYSERALMNPGGYEICKYSFTTHSDDYSCTALNYFTGKNGILNLSVTEGFINFAPVENATEINLVRVN